MNSLIFKKANGIFLVFIRLNESAGNSANTIINIKVKEVSNELILKIEHKCTITKNTKIFIRRLIQV